MKTLLQINASLFSGEGASSRLADDFVSAWRRRHPESEVVVRDLAREPIPHLTAERFGAFLADEATRNPEQREAVACSDALIDEIRRADVVVIGLPMYNFGVPSTLKAWFDHVARAGVTFRYTPDGPVGLLGGRKVYVIATRGGRYEGTPLDTESAYVRQILSFLGLDDVEFVYAEGLAVGEESRQTAIEQARRDIARLAA